MYISFCSVIMLPIAITFYVTWWFIHFVDGFFSPIYAQLGIDIFGWCKSIFSCHIFPSVCLRYYRVTFSCFLEEFKMSYLTTDHMLYKISTVLLFIIHLVYSLISGTFFIMPMALNLDLVVFILVYMFVLNSGSSGFGYICKILSRYYNSFYVYTCYCLL